MADPQRRQFVKYNFYKVDPVWRRLSKEERNDNRREFAAVVEESSTHMLVRSYSLVGLRGDSDFLLWQAADSLDSLQEVATSLWSTGLGHYLTQPHSYLAMTRSSQYVGQHRHAGQEGTRVEVRREAPGISSSILSSRPDNGTCSLRRSASA